MNIRIAANSNVIRSELDWDLTGLQLSHIGNWLTHRHYNGLGKKLWKAGRGQALADEFVAEQLKILRTAFHFLIEHMLSEGAEVGARNLLIETISELNAAFSIERQAVLSRESVRSLREWISKFRELSEEFDPIWVYYLDRILARTWPKIEALDSLDQITEVSTESIAKVMNHLPVTGDFWLQIKSLIDSGELLPQKEEDFFWMTPVGYCVDVGKCLHFSESAYQELLAQGRDTKPTLDEFARRLSSILKGPFGLQFEKKPRIGSALHGTIQQLFPNWSEKRLLTPLSALHLLALTYRPELKKDTLIKALRSVE